MKTQEQVLNQQYMSPADLKILVPTLGIDKCRTYINEIRAEMKVKNYLVPETKPKVALTHMVKKRLGIK